MRYEPGTNATRSIAALLAVLGLALALAGCGGGSGEGSAGKRAPADFDVIGQWEGTLHQLGLGAFEIDAEIDSLEDATENRVSYTVIDCSGTWDYRGMEGRAFRFRETIESGGGSGCEGKGKVTLTPAGADELDYAFKGGGVESRGTLERAG